MNSVVQDPSNWIRYFRPSQDWAWMGRGGEGGAGSSPSPSPSPPRERGLGFRAVEYAGGAEMAGVEGGRIAERWPWVGGGG